MEERVPLDALHHGSTFPNLWENIQERGGRPRLFFLLPGIQELE